MAMASKNLFLFLLFFMLFVSCGIKVKKHANFQNSSYYLDIDAAITDQNEPLGHFQTSFLFFKNINDTVDVYIDGSFSKRLISEKDSLSSLQTSVDLEIENKNNHQRIEVYLISERKYVTFYIDPLVPFYDVYYLKNGFFRINGYMGDVPE